MKYPLVIGNFQQWNPICTLFKTKSVNVATKLWYYTYIYKRGVGQINFIL